MQGTLAKDGVKFDDDGAILNYFEVYQKKLAEVNAIVDKYNSFTDSEAQEKYQETMDNAIEEFNKFVENMGRVDEIVTDLIPGLEKDVQDATDELRDFLFEHVYHNPVAKSEESKAQEMLMRLFEYYVKNPDKMPALYRGRCESDGVERCACDFISGMTDRYAIDVYSELYVPKVWRRHRE